jgi:tetratricopeptide (TPR) repeat protein
MSGIIAFMPVKSLLATLLVLLTLIAYGPIWVNDFIDLDDPVYVTGNPEVKQGFTAESWHWAWTTFHAGFWHPLTWLSLQLDAQLFSEREPEREPLPSAAAFHADNLVWHIATTLLLFALWHRLTSRLWSSFVVAALFALHPMHVESVAWAAERKDVLSAFFGVLTIWFYVRYVEAPGVVRYLAVLGAFVLGLLAKPMLVTLPCVLLLLDYWPLRRWQWHKIASTSDIGGATARAPVALGRLVLEKVPLLILAAAASFMTVRTQQHGGAIVTWEALPLDVRLSHAVTSYVWYLEKTFWPQGLAIYYPHPFTAAHLALVLLAFAFLLGVTVFAFLQSDRRPWLVVGWLWFLGTLFPVIGLVQAGDQAYADRFSYLPHVGLFVAVVWGAVDILSKLRIGVPRQAVATIIVLALLAVCTWRQVGYWRDSRTVWEHALDVTTANHRAHSHWAQLALDEGDLATARAHFAEAVRIRPDDPDHRQLLSQAFLLLGDLDEAAVQFLETLSRKESAEAWHDLGLIRLRQGRAVPAERCFRKALAFGSDNSLTHANLGLALWRQGKHAEATRELETALQLNPVDHIALNGLGLAELFRGRNTRAAELFTEAIGAATRTGKFFVPAYSNLGLALSRERKWQNAIRFHREAVQRQATYTKRLRELGGKIGEVDGIPDVVTYRCRLAQALNRVGSQDEASQEYERASEIAPDWPTRYAARAWMLATHPVAEQRDPVTALEMLEQVQQAVADPSAQVLDSLAAAQAAAGRFPEAVATCRRALAKPSALNDKHGTRAIAERLKLYMQGRPFVDTEVK